MVYGNKRLHLVMIKVNKRIYHRQIGYLVNQMHRLGVVSIWTDVACQEKLPVKSVLSYAISNFCSSFTLTLCSSFSLQALLLILLSHQTNEFIKQRKSP